MQFKRSLVPAFFMLLLFAANAASGQAEERQESEQPKAEAVDKQKKKSKKSDDKESKQEEKKPGLRQISLTGTYVDHPQGASFDPTALLTGGIQSQKSFYKLVEFIDELSDDEKFDYVLFDLSAPLSLNSVQLDELSRHLKKLTDAKKTYAWLENADNVALSVAANCDKTFMADFGGIDMPSNAMRSIFFGDAFNLFGVKASVVRAGNFKGAVEPFLNAKMSSHLREHNVEMLTSLNDSLVDRIARARGLKKSTVRELQKERVLVGNEAVEAGLVDALAPYGAMRETIESEIGEDIEWVTAKKARKKDMSFFQLMSEIMAGPSSSKFKKNTIAVIHLNGMIVDGKKKSPGMMVSGPTVAMIEKLAKEERVKAAVVRINSPGGSATASEAIRQALLKLGNAKPTVVSMGSVAASGGYWISCIDTPVFAERGTVTGSIGVFSMKLSAGALMRRIGVHMENITLDDAANAYALDQSWDQSDVDRMQKVVDMVYDRFLGLVSNSRDISVDDLHDLAGGRVWTGAQALDRNLVDHIGGLDDCLSLVAKKAKLGDDYTVAHRPVASSGLDIGSLIGGGDDEEIFSSLPSLAVQWMQRNGLKLDQTKVLLNDGLKRKGTPTAWLLSPFEFSIN